MLRLTALAGRATSRLASAAATALPAAPTYSRHAPERTLLYALVQAHYPDFIARIEAEDRSIFDYRNTDKRTRHDGWENLQVLESEGNRDAIEQRLARHLQRHRDAGTITDDCYRQAAGFAPSRETLHTRGLDAHGAAEHERIGQEPRDGLSVNQARFLIGNASIRTDLRSDELARAHCVARQDTAWANDYDRRHGNSVATRSQLLATHHGKQLATTLQTIDAAVGTRHFPELKPYYEALQATAAALQHLPRASFNSTISVLKAKLASELSAGKLRTQPDRSIELESGRKRDTPRGPSLGR